MLFYYSLSQDQDKLLKEIDALRMSVLITPLNPTFIQKLQFNSYVNRIYWGVSLDNIVFGRDEIIKMITNQYPKIISKYVLTKQKVYALNYRNILDHIYWEWSASESLVESKDVYYLYLLLFSKIKPTNILKEKTSNEISQILRFVQSGKDHVLIKASLIYLCFKKLHFFNVGNEAIAWLLQLLILYKNGYDLRGFICLEALIKNDKVEFEKALTSSIHTGHASFFIEYYLAVYKKETQRILSLIGIKEIPDSTETYTYLTDRQKNILLQLNSPNATITNRKVQQLFKVSQITASRDLAKLVEMGLTTSFGKGRSIYYSRNFV